MSYKSNQVLKTLERKLQIKFRQGSNHHVGLYYLDDKLQWRTQIPYGRDPIGKKLFGMMARQLKLSSKDFSSFLDCNIDKNGYDKILRS